MQPYPRLDSSEATMMEFRVTASGAAKLPAILEVGSRMSDVGNRNSARAARKLEVGGRMLEVGNVFSEF
jgi:hypothetical protein